MSGPSQSRRQEYFQEHWNDFEPVQAPILAQGESTELPLSSVSIKKKCRGNRRLQRYRAKLRRQGFTEEAIGRLINENPQASQPNRTTTEQTETMAVVAATTTTTTNTTSKRKRVARLTNLPTSISQVTIAPPPNKRSRPLTTTSGTSEIESAYKADYLRVPDQVFKRMLKDSLEGAESIIEWLDSTEKLQYARDYTHRVNNLFFLRMKNEYLENYYTTMNNTGIWSMTLSSTILNEHNLHHIKFSSEDNLQRRRQQLSQALQETEHQLETHKQVGKDRGIDINRLFTVIPAFVRRGQHRLKADFERKKLLLQMDTQDYRSIQAFYDLHPSNEEIISAKVIWEATKKKQQQENHSVILKQRVYTRRLPASFNLLDHSIDNTEKILTQPGLNEDKRITLSDRRQKTIAQFKYDLMTIQITIVEELIRSYLNIIAEEKKKLVESANGQVPLPKHLAPILHAITKRQTNIMERIEFIHKKTLSHFEDAPIAVEEMAGTIGAMS